MAAAARTLAGEAAAGHPFDASDQNTDADFHKRSGFWPEGELLSSLEGH